MNIFLQVKYFTKLFSLKTFNLKESDRLYTNVSDIEACPEETAIVYVHTYARQSLASIKSHKMTLVIRVPKYSHKSKYGTEKNGETEGETRGVQMTRCESCRVNV